MGDHKFKGVLLDLGGVVFFGQTPIEGALEAVDRLHEAGLPVRFLTNTTRRSSARLRTDLSAMRLEIPEADLLTPARLAVDYLTAHGLSPHLLVHEGLEEEFAALPRNMPEAVVIGDAGERFTFANLNAAYRKLEAGAKFLVLAENRNFKDADGELSMDAGAFVRALEYASGRQAKVLGKPSADFFALAVESLGCLAHEAVMVGDDAEADVGGAMAAGLAGVLVRTGKYREGDEDRLDPPPAHVAADLEAAVAWILAEA
ncbi:MAG: TIGR01458 family HAD-type hydrolase [Paracoccaceae bacterium]|nr:TIGR01458 family HAD-type hydrolase [Paracoccaceae bacterium]